MKTPFHPIVAVARYGRTILKSTRTLTLCGILLSWPSANAQQIPTFTKITQGPLVNDRLGSLYGHWGDYDNDGRLDVLVTGPMNQWRLYHNDGGAIFSAVIYGVMSQRSLHGMWGAWGDPNNDGGLDFYAGPTWNTSESPWMYWNDGHGNFVRQAVGPEWTSNHVPLQGVLNTWGDFDRDGFLDAFLGGGFSGVVARTVTSAVFECGNEGGWFLGDHSD